MSQGPPAREQLNSPRRWLSSALAPVRDFLFPPACLTCGDSISDVVPSLCDVCRKELSQPAGPRCARCAAPAGPHLDTSQGCVRCRDDRFAFRRVLALGVYDGLLRSTILRGKQAHGAPLIVAATDLLIEWSTSDLLTEPFDAIVPVPHHWRHRFWRMHNPAETIAERIALRLERSYVPHLLRKPKATPSQAAAPPSLRRRQQRGAFQATGITNFTGVRVLLVDDVLTTGATANAAAKALRERGAADVMVAVLARGLGHGPVGS